MLILFIIVLIILLCYVLLTFLFFVGLLRLKGADGEVPASKQELTVIIPFRNEVEHLPGIILDLEAQNYPDELFSVLLVNDHSTDGSKELVSSLVDTLPAYTCLDLPETLEGKKEAIAFAILQVKSSWVLQTDADCRLGPGFISSHMRFLEASPSDLVSGLVTTGEERGGFLEAFERLDLLSLNGTGAGSSFYGRTMMCSGANLLYSLDLYHETRSFDPAGKTGSGDDMFLLIGARKLGRRVSHNPDRDSVVQTSPVRTLTEMVRQRIRWGAKSAHYGMWDIQFLAILVALVNLLVFFSPVLMIVEAESCRWLLPGLGLKMLIDFLLLTASCVKSAQVRTLWWYIPVALAYPPYMVLVIAGSLFSRPLWKGRKVQESFLR